MKKVVLVFFFLIFSFKTYAQEIICCSALTANQIMVLTVAKAQLNDRLKQGRLVYDEEHLFDELNYRGELLGPTKKENKTIDGKRGQLAGIDLSIGQLLERLATGHDFSFAPSILRDGERFAVIEFKPKPGLKYITNEDKFINRLRGKLYIYFLDYSLWKVEAEIPERDEFKFRVWRGPFFLTINIKSFRLEFEQVTYGDIMVEKRIGVVARFVALSATKTRRYTYYYDNYRYK